MRLADALAEVEAGIRPAGGATERSGTIPSIGGENISPDGRMRYAGLKKIPRGFFESMRRGHLAAGDVLINKDGAQTGKVAIYDGHFAEAAINEHVFLLRGRTGVLDQRFLYHFLASESAQRQIARVITGSAQPGLKSEFPAHIEMALPPLDEQFRVSERLDVADRAIADAEGVIAKLKRVRAGTKAQLLSFGVEDGVARDPNKTLVRESEIGPIPTSWTVARLRDIAELITSGSRGWARYYASRGATFLRIGNLTRDHLNLRMDDVVHVNPPSGGEGARTALRAGDVLISITADLGIIGVVPSALGEAYVNQHVALVRLRPGAANARWIGSFLAGVKGQRQFSRLNDSGAKAGLNLPAIGALSVALPSLSEQNVIVDAIDALDGRIVDEERCLEKLRRLKRGLAQDLLDGVSAAQEATV